MPRSPGRLGALLRVLVLAPRPVVPGGPLSLDHVVGGRFEALELPDVAQREAQDARPEVTQGTASVGGVVGGHVATVPSRATARLGGGR